MNKIPDFSLTLQVKAHFGEKCGDLQILHVVSERFGKKGCWNPFGRMIRADFDIQARAALADRQKFVAPENSSQ